MLVAFDLLGEEDSNRNYDFASDAYSFPACSDNTRRSPHKSFLTPQSRVEDCASSKSGFEVAG